MIMEDKISYLRKIHEAKWKSFVSLIDEWDYLDEQYPIHY